jgi:hypothetical protein
MKTAFEMTEEEFEAARIPFRSVGTFKSINNKHTIHILSNKKSGTAGLAYLYPVMIDGKNLNLPFALIQKYNFELPEDYDYFVVWGLVQQYKKEMNVV